jgi:signal transduction histidine kinase
VLSAGTQMPGPSPTGAEGALTDEVRRLVHEEQSLRRVAQAVATAGPPDDILGAICRAAADQVDGQAITLLRFVTDDTIVAVATHGGPVPPGTRVVHQPGSMSEEVARTNRAVRVDDFERRTSAGIVGTYGIRSGVGVPIVIEGRVWGMFSATSQTGPLPLDTEARLEGFAQLVWAAIATTDSRGALRRLVDEQAALRHVAELVARESPPSAVIDAVVREGGRVLEASSAAVVRDDGPVSSVVAHARFPREVGEERADVPVLVEGERWGVLTVTSAATGHPVDRDRLTPFADLIAAAIANARNRDDLTQSRARVIAAADDARRRLQRDVHDGAQQRLVHTIITLKLARARVGGGGDVAGLLAEALTNAEDANRQLRDIVRGILPASLTRAGLAAGIDSLVSGTPIPVDVDVDIPRLATAVETTGDVTVAEAINNAVKHSRATRIRVVGAIREDTGELILTIEDDGVGGADPARGSGLTGLRDRIDASNGTITVTSRPGAGTVITARIPLHSAPEGPAEGDHKGGT